METKKMITKNEVSEKTFSEVFINAKGEIRKAAFSTFNRDLNLKNVSVIEEKMRGKGYRIGEPIQVVRAEYVSKRGVIACVDINGKPISSDEYENYFLVLDGSHRTHAASQYNDWLISQSKPQIEIPAIEVELINNETVTEYSNEINCTKNLWSNEDYVNGAACVYSNNELLQRYNELIKSESNPKGFKLSTLNLIFCNSTGLTKKDLILLCSGASQKGSKVKKDIMPAYDIQTGNEFIRICKEKGFKDAEITKRYLAQEFNKLRNSQGGIKLAFEVFNHITKDDISMMTNDNDNLDAQEVIDHFKEMTTRINLLKTNLSQPAPIEAEEIDSQIITVESQPTSAASESAPTELSPNPIEPQLNSIEPQSTQIDLRPAPIEPQLP